MTERHQYAKIPEIGNTVYRPVSVQRRFGTHGSGTIRFLCCDFVVSALRRCGTIMEANGDHVKISHARGLRPHRPDMAIDPSPRLHR